MSSRTHPAPTPKTPVGAGGIMEFLLLAVVFFHWFGQFTYVAYFTPYMTGFHIPATAVGVIVGSYGLTQLCLRIPMGITADLYRRHKLYMTIGMAFMVLSGVLLLTATTPFVFGLARASAGVASATWVCFTIYYVPLSTAPTPEKAMARIMAANSLGLICGYFFGSVFIDRLGIRFLFLTTTVAGIICFVLMLFVRADDPPPRANPLRLSDVISVLKDKNLINCALLCGLIQLINYATSLSFLSNFAEMMGATGFEIGMLSTLFSAAMFFSSMWLGSSLRDRFSNRFLMLMGFILTVIYCAGIPLSGNILALDILQILCGLGKNFVMVVTMSVGTHHIAPELKTSAMGIYQSIYGLGMTFGSPIMGAIIDATGGNYPVSFYCIAALSGFGILWVLLTFYRKNGVSAHNEF